MPAVVNSTDRGVGPWMKLKSFSTGRGGLELARKNHGGILWRDRMEREAAVASLVTALLGEPDKELGPCEVVIGEISGRQRPSGIIPVRRMPTLFAHRPYHPPVRRTPRAQFREYDSP